MLARQVPAEALLIQAKTAIEKLDRLLPIGGAKEAKCAIDVARAVARGDKNRSDLAEAFKKSLAYGGANIAHYRYRPLTPCSSSYSV